MGTAIKQKRTYVFGCVSSILTLVCFASIPVLFLFTLGAGMSADDEMSVLGAELMIFLLIGSLIGTVVFAVASIFLFRRAART